MKLIYCPACEDIVRMTHRTRKCRCKLSWGRYLSDGLHATIGGRAIPLGISNGSFYHALGSRQDTGAVTFMAFVIERNCPTVTVDG